MYRRFNVSVLHPHGYRPLCPLYKTKLLYLVSNHANEPVDVVRMGRYFIAAAPVQHIQPWIQASIFIQDLIFLVQDGLAPRDVLVSINSTNFVKVGYVDFVSNLDRREARIRNVFS